MIPFWFSLFNLVFNLIYLYKNTYICALSKSKLELWESSQIM